MEYEDCTSEEARVVKDLDKLEMVVQADEYERGTRSTHFWEPDVLVRTVVKLVEERHKHPESGAVAGIEVVPAHADWNLATLVRTIIDRTTLAMISD